MQVAVAFRAMREVREVRWGTEWMGIEPELEQAKNSASVTHFDIDYVEYLDEVES
jgi:hypothetical protein